MSEPRTSLAASGARSELVAEAMDRADRTAGFGTDVGATLQWCVEVGRKAPRVGEGDTRGVWELLAATAARDVSAARMLEPHLDALSILRQSAGSRGADGLADVTTAELGVDARSTWGVFAAEAPAMRLEARPDAEGWMLRGTKPWCSLAGDLTHALVTASVDDRRRGLFAVALQGTGIHVHAGPWFARGMTRIVSAPVDFDDAPAVAIGEPQWYLTRHGFAWGGMSVAACWWGGAVGIAQRLVAAARSERADQLALVHAGRVDAALWAARAALAEAADLIDDGGSKEVDDRLLAERVRAVVVEAATLTLAESDAALGPGPLVTDDAHARRVADLHLYLRQHHGPRDLARIGSRLAEASS